jgi:hypothetical protein
VVILYVIAVIGPADNPAADNSAAVYKVCILYEGHLLQNAVGCAVAEVKVVAVPTVAVPLPIIGVVAVKTTGDPPQTGVFGFEVTEEIVGGAETVIVVEAIFVQLPSTPVTV